MFVLGNEFNVAAMTNRAFLKNNKISSVSNQINHPLQITSRRNSARSRNTCSMWHSVSITLAITIAIAFAQLHTANAKPLSADKCKELIEQQKTLQKDPIVIQMEKGFEWVKENIKGDALSPIKQYLDVSDQLNFRCPNKSKPKKTAKKPEKIEKSTNPKDKKDTKKPADKDLKDVKTTNSIPKIKTVTPEKTNKQEKIKTKPEAALKKKPAKSIDSTKAVPDEKSSDNSLLNSFLSAISPNEEKNKSDNLGKSAAKIKKPAPKTENKQTSTKFKNLEDNSVHPFF